MGPTQISKIKINKNLFIDEVRRISKKLKKYPVAPKSHEYSKHCKDGFSLQRIYRKLGLNLVDAIEKSELVLKGTSQKMAGKGKQIICNGEKISKTDCVPGNRPNCSNCSYAEKAKIKAVPDVSDEEAKSLVHNTSRHLNGADNLYSLEI
jgi:hypothetical protein